jgi:transposase
VIVRMSAAGEKLSATRVANDPLVAEIGDVTRFRSAEALCSWAGLTPKHRESDTTVGGDGSPSKARSWCGGR